MSGWLKRLTKAAKSVKTELDKSGLLEKEQESGAPAKTPGQRSGRSEGFSKILATGVADPFGLIAREEVADALGVAVGDPAEGYDDDSISCEFRGEHEGDVVWAAVHVSHGGEGGRPNPAVAWDYYVSVSPSRTNIGGLGEAAFRAGDGTVFVAKAGQILYVNGGSPEGSPIVDALESVARTCAGRL